MSGNNHYKVWLFDFDYTLVDSSEASFMCLNYALEKCGFEKVRLEVAQKCIGYTLTEVYFQLTGNPSPEAAIKFRKYFREKADQIGNEYTQLYEYVPEVLERLQEKGIKLGIVSTKNRFRIERFLNIAGLLDKFEVIIGGEDVMEHKPSPEPLEKAFQKFGYKKEQFLYTGDSIVDAGAANAFGMDFTAVLSGVTPKEEFVPFKPVEIAENLKEVTLLPSR